MISHSIQVSFETKRDLEKMISFLKTHSTPLKTIISNSDLFPNISAHWNFMFMSDDELVSSDNFIQEVSNENLLLGFHYSASECQWEIDYFHALCFWMATKSSKHINNRPFVLFDKSTVWELFINETPPDKSNKIKINEVGFEEVSFNTPIDSLSEDTKKSILENNQLRMQINDLIHSELRRLDNEWDLHFLI